MDPLAPPVQLLAEAAAPADGWWTAVAGCARAAAEAGAQALRVERPPSVALVEGDFVELRKAVLRLELDFVATVATAEEVAFFRRVGVGGLAAWVRHGSGDGSLLWDAVGSAHLPVYLLGGAEACPEEARALDDLLRYDVEVTLLVGAQGGEEAAHGLGLARLSGGGLPPRVVVGFADRSGTGWPAVAAAALGAGVVALPLGLSPYLPSDGGAVGPELFRRTAEGVRYLGWARGREALG